MSRFMLMSAHEAYVLNGGRQRLKGGTMVADSIGNALAGDVVCPQLCSSPTRGMVALGSGAVSAFAAIGIATTVGQVMVLGSGVDG
jgi:hypothetical protein